MLREALHQSVVKINPFQADEITEKLLENASEHKRLDVSMVIAMLESEESLRPEVEKIILQLELKAPMHDDSPVTDEVKSNFLGQIISPKMEAKLREFFSRTLPKDAAEAAAMAAAAAVGGKEAESAAAAAAVLRLIEAGNNKAPDQLSYSDRMGLVRDRHRVRLMKRCARSGKRVKDT